jgi:hypothetical protein
LDRDKSAAAHLACSEVPLLLPITNLADNIEIHLKSVTFPTVGTKFGGHNLAYFCLFFSILQTGTGCNVKKQDVKFGFSGTRQSFGIVT